MKVLLLVISLFFSFIFLSETIGQDLLEPCGSGAKHDQLILDDISYRTNVDAINERALLSNVYRMPVVHTIPVVVHVIHEGEPIGQSSNITDEQVQSAIVALNQDFRKEANSNGDGDGVDVEIQFCLASRDPNGDPTTGIVRVDGSVVLNYAEQGIEANNGTGANEEDVKSLSVWPREDYVNIWVVNEIENNDASGGIQGYAYFPYDNFVDGIVVLHKAFGTVGNLKPNTDENRVITHEMGHYFSLYHTFHTTSTCDSETNCATQGDRVCDTPTTILNVSCNSPACQTTQQVENYMDYTPETCQDMFTQGQKDRMRACLLTDRATLLNSLGCIPPTEYDAGISSISAPVGSICDNNVEPVVTLTNFGSTVLTFVDISYGVNGNLDQSFEWTGSIEPGMGLEIVLPNFFVANGNHELYVETGSPNGQVDQFNSNDGASSIFSISPGIPLVLDVTLDYYGHETTWEILDTLGYIVAAGGPYPDMELGVTYQEFICAPTGCYDLVFHDLFGDGMGFVNGHYELYGNNDSLLIEGGGNFGLIESNEFCYIQEVPPGETPDANFSVSSASICAGETVNFTDQSLNLPTSWSWTFEGGSPAISTQQNPTNIVFSTPGNYEITLIATNEFGSSSFLTNIVVEANPTLTLTSTDLLCNGINTGSITSQATGNSLSYLWSNASTDNNLTNVGQGDYTLVVTTPGGCTISSTATVEAPDQLEISLSGHNLSCNGLNDGEVISTVNGGTGSYTYLWSNNETSSNLVNLSSGYYVVTVSDENECQSTADITLTQSSVIEANLIDIDINCSNGLGSAEVSPSGGNGEYQIEWSTGSSETSISGLNTGSYWVTISDTGGCSVTENFIISQTIAPTVSVDKTDVSCFGLEDGQATIVASGGQGSYTYDWSNGFDQISSNSLQPGSYTVVVEDEAGCQASVNFEIAQPEELSLTLEGQNISCFNREDGIAMPQVAGGTGQYSYSWSNGQSGSIATELSEGNVGVIITDEAGCSIQGFINIEEPNPIVVDVEESTEETCVGGDGSATVSAIGGTGVLSYEWSNGTSGMFINGVSSGIYNVEVIDENLCTVSESVLIGYNCDEIPLDSLTKLIEPDCGRTELNISDYLTCIEVNDAEMYQWKFFNTEGLFYEGFTIGSNETFQLQHVEGIHYDLSIDVCVRFRKNGSWSAFGDVCTVSLKNNIPVPEMIDTYCLEEEHQYNDILLLNSVIGADEYQWVFTSDDPMDTIIMVSFINQITITPSIGFLENVEYQVVERVKIGTSWSDFSGECPFFIKSEEVGQQVVIEEDEFDIYPNPSDGNNLFLDLGNLFGSDHVIDIELYNTSGKLVETFVIVPENEATKIVTHNFKQPLVSGIYLIRYTHDGETNEKKLIVQ